MSSPCVGKEQESHGKLKQHLDELESQIRSIKSSWSDDDCVFKADHHEIEENCKKVVQHVSRIRDQVELIKDQKTKDMESVSRRTKEEKARVRSLRASRSSSMKYVVQWEKMMDQQQKDGAVSEVKTRKNSPSSKPTEENVPKKMVRSRVQHFEEIQQRKRASSTIEPFLDTDDQFSRIFDTSSSDTDDDKKDKSSPSSSSESSSDEEPKVKRDGGSVVKCQELEREEAKKLKDQLFGLKQDTLARITGNIEELSTVLDLQSLIKDETQSTKDLINKLISERVQYLQENQQDSILNGYNNFRKKMIEKQRRRSDKLRKRGLLYSSLEVVYENQDLESSEGTESDKRPASTILCNEIEEVTVTETVETKRETIETNKMKMQATEKGSNTEEAVSAITKPKVVGVQYKSDLHPGLLVLLPPQHSDTDTSNSSSTEDSE